MRVVVTIPSELPDRVRVRLALGFLEWVVATNRAILQAMPWLPRLYDSGVVYKPEPDDEESFVDMLEVLKTGHGDCSHLAAWRTAEMQNDILKAMSLGLRGPPSRWPQARAYARPESGLVHVQSRNEPTLRYPRGQIEDPSRFLGMADMEVLS